MSQTWKIVNGDIVRYYTNTGYVFVEDTDKIKQDVQMVLTTDERSTTGLGCGLDGAIGDTVENPSSVYMQAPVAFEFQNRVRVGMNRLRSAQRTYQFSQRTPKELLYDAGSVQIWPDFEDPRNFRWRLDVSTVDSRSSFQVNGSTKG